MGGTDLHREAELLSAIIANPDDDEARLRYAAWLEARGDPRGTFIRAHCLLASGRLRQRGASEQREVIKELLGTYLDSWWLGQPQKAWSGSGAQFEDWACHRAWSRGFQEVVKLSADELVATGREIFARTPVRKLILVVTGAEELSRALACEALDSLRSLEIYYHPSIGAAGAKALAQCPHLRALVELEAVECAFDAAAAAALASSSQLRGLRRLDLSQNALGDDGVAALVDAPLCADLTELCLSRCEVGDRGAEAIAASPHLQRLRELVVLANEIGRSGARALVTSPQLPRLKTVNLRFNRVRRRLSSRPGLTVLTS